MRVLATVAPVLISVVTLLGLGRLWPRPASIGVAIVWWVLLSLTATVVLWAADRWFRRLLPVSALFRLSLVFPDKAPSRFRTALRAGTVRQLKRSVESGNFSRAAPQEAAEQLIALAATLNDHDRQTRGHTERVRAYSVMIGEGMGLAGDDLEFLNWSGLVHDIGKLAVPSEILNKPGKPTEAEWATLRTHPAKADLLIEPLRPWLGMWAESATEHHEWFDGTGYPNGIAGSDISLAGRIVAVADAYDVMTSTRSYKKPMSADAARKELAANAGTQFDPEVVRAFLTVSIGRLRLVMGPISSILQFPAGNASLGAAAASGASAATAMSIAVIAGLGSPPVELAAPPPEIVAMVAPAAADLQITGLEDGTLRADVGANTTNQLTNVYLLSDPAEGRASVSEDGVVTFTPDANFHGDVTVAYEACFADGSCDEATVTFTVESVNDAPEADADALTISEDSTAVIDVLANDADVDGDTIQIASAEVVSDPSHQLVPDQVTVEGATLVVVPGRDAWGSTLIRYSIVDPAGATDTADVLLTVTPVNDAPIARNDSLTMIRDSAAVIAVLTNDGDVDGDPISITSVALAGNGTATTDGSSVRFVPTAGFTGTANFTYEISDAAGATAQAKAVITVVKPSSQLSLGADTATTLEDQPTVIDVLANDSTPTSSLDLTSLRLNALPSNGTAVLSGSQFSYQPDANWEGVDSFGYSVCDLDGGCKTAVVTVTVVGVNDAPSFTAGADPSVAEDSGALTATAWATSVSTGPSNESAQALAFAVTTSDPTLFSTQPAINPAGDLTFTPAANTVGTATVTITATDDGGTLNGGTDTSPAQTATVTITNVNDAPSFTAGADPTVAEDSGAFTATGWATAISAGPPNESGQTLAFTVTASDPTLFAAQPALNPAGDLTFTPAANTVGTATVTITATDGGGTLNGGTDTSPAQTATVTITNVNDAPSFTAGADPTVAEDSGAFTATGWATAISAGPPNESGQTLAFTVTASDPTLFAAQPAINPAGELTFTPAPNANGAATLTITLADDGGGTDTSPAQTATITITNVNDTPSFATGADPTVAEDSGAFTATAWATAISTGPADESGQTVTFTVTASDPTLFAAQPAINPAGDLTFTPASNANGVATLTITLSDDGGGADTSPAQTITVTLTGVNDAPSFVGGADPTVTEDSGPFTATAWATAISTGPADESSQTVAFTVTASDPTLFSTQPAISPAGDLTFTPALNANGAATITITATDDGGGTDTSPAQTATVTITGVNDAPSFTAGADPTVAEDSGAFTATAWATAISTGPADESGQTVTFSVTASDPTLFAVQPAISPAGDLTFTPANNTVGTATITITLTDDGGGTDTSPAQTATVTITNVNDAPVAVADSPNLVEDQVGGISFDAIANDTDLDGDTVLYSSANLSTVDNGTVVDNLDGTFDYTPDENFNGTETFDYTINDGNGGIATGTVTITVSPAPDAPVATDDARATDVDATLTVAAPGLLVNDYDVDQESLTVNPTPVVSPAFGAVTISPDGGYVYVPSGGFSGTDSFTYEISDPGGLTATATATITVDSGLVTQEYYFGDSGSSAADYNLTTVAPVSSLPVFDADGDGSPGLSIKAGDGKDDETDDTKFQTWTMTAASPIELSGPVTFDLWAAVKDFRNDKGAHPWVYLYDCLGGSCTTIAETDLHRDPWSPGPSDFVLRQIDLGSVSYTVPAGNDLVVRLQFGHEDMWVAMTADYPSALSLTLANPAPLAVADSITVLEDAPSQNVAVLANDVDTDLDPASVVVSAAASDGIASPVGDGTINYVPNTDFNGIDSFTYQVCDLSGSCATATVTITVTAVNDAPTFANGGNVTAVGIGASSFPGWASAMISGPADEGGQVLTFTIIGNDAVGLFAAGPTIDPVTGDLEFTATSSGTATITVELSDDGGTANGGADTSAPVTFTITVP